MTSGPPTEPLEVVYELTAALSQAEDLPSAFDASLEALMTGVRVDRASLMLFDDQGLMRFRAWRGLSADYRAAVEGHSPWEHDETNPQPIYCGDTETDPAMEPYREAFRAEGIRTLGFLPLVSHGQLIGKLMLYADQPTRWGEPELRLAANIASHVAFAIQRLAAEETLRSSNSTLSTLAEHVPVAILLDDEHGTIAFCNQRFSDLWDLPDPSQLKGRRCRDVADGILGLLKAPEVFVRHLEEINTTRVPMTGVELDLTDGRTLEQGCVPVEAKGRLVGRLWTYEDVTQRKRMQQRMLQSNKMESLGSLAGGIAHDFNNILTSILGYTHLLRSDLEPESPASDSVDQLLRISNKASELTRQLLAFARRQPLERTAVDVAAVVEDSAEMFRRLLGPNIQILISQDTAHHVVDADSGQIHQVLLNLVGNARDAMPDGGRLGIEVTRVCAPDNSSDQVQILVRDTGTGMSPDTMARAFEPFFTTKEPGRGTGLGLATCYGIVNQFDGEIHVESTPGAGTTFVVCFPASTDPPTRETATDPPPAEELRGTETVLLVEDEADIRNLLATTLRGLGYTVDTAADGQEAWEKLQAGLWPDIVVTDVMMPRMGGRELLARARAVRPDQPFLLITGYVRDGDAPPAEVPALQKPFAPQRLAQRIRETLPAPVAAP